MPRLKTTPTETRPRWLTVKQVAEQLQVSDDAIYRACATKGLRYVKLGHSTLRLRQDWLEAWMEAQASSLP